jgi:hypothetical protein
MSRSVTAPRTETKATDTASMVRLLMVTEGTQQARPD